MRHIAWALVLLTGCADFESGTYQTPQERAFEQKALPVFEAQCIACHGNPQFEFAFLTGDTPAEIRASVLASGVVDLEHPIDSPIFVKGAHTGPPMTVSQARALLDWIDVERSQVANASF